MTTMQMTDLDSVDAVEVGARIAERRKNRQFSQADLSSVMPFYGRRISQSVISRWESGRDLPDAEEIAALAENLGTTAEWLLTGEGVSGAFDDPSDWCESCGRAEPIAPDGGYRTCQECWHHWPTKADFVADVRKWGEDEDPDAQTMCPLCAHDW